MKRRVIRWYFHILSFRNWGRDLNRRAGVEQILLDVANGKREMLSKQECRELAFKLAGVEKGNWV